MLSVSSLQEKLSVNVAVGGFAIASVVVFLIKTLKTKEDLAKTRRKTHRPDTTLPLLQNTLDLVRHGLRGDMHHYFLKLGKQFDAEPVEIRSLGVPLNFLCYQPQVFEDVLKTQFNNFTKGPFSCENMRDLLGEGIFAVDGDKWVHQRKTASRLFTMRALRDSMTSTIQRHALVLYDILHRASEKQETLDLFRLLNRFTIEAFTEIGFGVHMNAQESEEEHPFQKAFDRAQQVLIIRFSRPGWFWRAQRWLGIGMEGQLKRDVQVIDKTVLEIVKKALAQRSCRGGDNADSKLNKPSDICSLFLDSVENASDADEQQFDPKYLRDIVVNFLIAGRDTTAQALSWFFFNLSQNPHVEAAIRKEIAEKLPAIEANRVGAVHTTMEEASQLVYLEAALKETLRLHPSVPYEMKYAVESTTLTDGTAIPKGSTVGLCTYAMARLPQVWGPDAEEFKPERWIDPATGKLIPVSTFKFASFLAGPRICLGMNLAMLEMKLVVVGLLSKFHVEVFNPEDVTYDLSLTLPVKGALNVKVSPANLWTFAEFA